MGELNCRVCNADSEKKDEFIFEQNKTGEFDQGPKEKFDLLNTKLSPELEQAKVNLETRLQTEATILNAESIEKYIESEFPEYKTIADQIPAGILESKGELLNKNTFSFPLLKYQSGEMYEGNFNEDGEKQGYGIQLIPGNFAYKGFWNKGIKDDYGCILYKDGNYYCGELQNEKKNGKGLYFVKDKFKYFGNFKDDQMNGEGNLEDFIEGTMYTGDFVNGVKEGKGTIIFADGSKYIGQFANNCFNGKGNLVNANKSSYFGDFVNGKMFGEGEFISTDGKIYRGHFENGIKSGFGKMIFNSNQYYEGNWFNNLQHGEGVYFNNGKATKGTYRFGKIISSITMN